MIDDLKMSIYKSTGAPFMTVIEVLVDNAWLVALIRSMI